jgi:hypothetical protein
LEGLSEVHITKIDEELTTEGSGPLLTLDEPGNFYYCKTTNTTVPRVEIINEVICWYMLKCWGFELPEIALARIKKEVAKKYEEEYQLLTQRYKNVDFDNELFFASKRLEFSTDVESFMTGIESRKDFKKFSNPLEIIMIGVFDLWVGNKDRKPGNPNILLSIDEEERFKFVPIDHTAAFAYLTNYKEVREVMLEIAGNNSILSAPIVKSITKFADSLKVQDLRNEIFQCMEATNQQLDFIFEQVPKEWGFSKKAKVHLKEFFADKARNERIARSYLNYL